MAKTGHDLYIYYNAGTHGSPTWTLVSQVEDVSVDELNWDSAELKRRASRFVLFLATCLRIGATFKLWHKLSATVYDALRGKFLDRTPTQFYIANGPVATTGTEGLRMYCQIFNFPWSQPLTEVSSHDVRIRPTYYESSGSEVLPDWYVIAGG